MIREKPTQAIRGVAALSEMLDHIGGVQENGDSVTDSMVAKVLTENELELRELVRYALNSLAND
jgi:hypothetical protein